MKVPLGDAFDKMTILEIKAQNVSDNDKKININNELSYIKEKLSKYFESTELKDLYKDLKDVNQALWDIEDSIRLKEKDKSFDQGFIDLARSVYVTNDKRAVIKKEINILLNSEFVEEKIYEKYD
jgi:hypothetical protein|tara:strand:+ start:1542 stop:1916 length:375 start_codon:yes stop_codon:yes gene_type:complete